MMVGTEARTRPSSVILPSSSSGTLRSLRTRTLRPERSPRSAIVFTAFSGSELAADHGDEVDQPAGVAPLVVVPADDLDLVADHLGQAGVEDARCGVGLDVLGHDRLVGVAQDALQRSLGGLLERGVDLLDGGLATGLDGEGRG